MKTFFTLLRGLLERCGCLQLVRYSGVHWALLHLRNPAYIRALREDEKFYRSLLGESQLSLIFDVGANVGDKAHVFARLSKRVICFEPDPRLAANLRARFRKNPSVEIMQVAISNHAGTMDLHTYDGGSAYNTLNAKQHEYALKIHQDHELIQVPVMTLDEAIHEYGMPDFLKVDVEGHELEVFQGLSALPRTLSFESNLPAFVSETVQIFRRLKTIGGAVRCGIWLSGAVPETDCPRQAEELMYFLDSPAAPRYLEIFVRKCDGRS